MKDKLNTALLVLIFLGVGANTVMLLNGGEKKTSRRTAESNDVSHADHNHSLAGAVDPAAQAQAATPQEPTGPATSIKFQEQTFDFGKIKQDTKNTHVFKFTNSGNEPLIIQNAQGSCGCTVPQYPKEPIPPGGTGEIIVEYNPGKQEGVQNKTVTITANTTPPQTLINISAMVEPVANAATNP